jgi:hypothetical protein
VDPVGSPSDEYVRPRWLQDTLKDTEGHASPKGTFRESMPPYIFSSYVVLTSLILSLPVLRRKHAKVWKDSMMEEYQTIMKNDVWDIFMRLEGKFVVTSKWIYKIKNDANCSIKKYKARFMARWFSHKEGVDYEGTFDPIAMYTSIMDFISLALVM